MELTDYVWQLFSARNRKGIKLELQPLHYKNGVFPFFRVSSSCISPADKVVLICAGVHGDEVAGPISILQDLNGIMDHAHELGLKLVIYPLRNPSGFHKNTRYNCDNDKGSAGNNDFLRYRLKTGEIVDDLKQGNDFEEWYWASDPRLKLELPLETQVMIDFLKTDHLEQVVAAIDLHQDYITPNLPPCAYHYAFGNLSVYGKIVQEIEKYVPVLRNFNISAGYNIKIDAAGKVIYHPSADTDDCAMLTDESGFIVRHDGSLIDLLHRLGVKYCVNPETSGATPLQTACKVNSLWSHCLIELASQR